MHTCTHPFRHVCVRQPNDNSSTVVTVKCTTESSGMNPHAACCQGPEGCGYAFFLKASPPDGGDGRILPRPRRLLSVPQHCWNRHAFAFFYPTVGQAASDGDSLTVRRFFPLHRHTPGVLLLTVTREHLLGPTRQTPRDQKSRLSGRFHHHNFWHRPSLFRPHRRKATATAASGSFYRSPPWRPPPRPRRTAIATGPP
jgi:hypothetical protein